MSDSKQRVRDIARDLGIDIADNRLEQLVQAYEQALEEAEVVRQKPNAIPTPDAFDAAWSKR